MTQAGTGAAPPAPQTETPRQWAPIAMGPNGLEIKTYDDCLRVGALLHQSQVGPKEWNEADYIVAMLFGTKFGLDVTECLSSVAIINRRPVLYGDVTLGLCMMKAAIFDHRVFLEWTDNDPNPDKPGPDLDAAPADMTKDTYTAHVRFGRKGERVARTFAFSVSDAKRAKLWKEPEADSSAWCKYPKDQLRFRALQKGLRRTYPDILRGAYTREEMMDADFLLGQIDLDATSDALIAASESKTSSERLAEQLTEQAPAPGPTVDAAPEPPPAATEPPTEPEPIPTGTFVPEPEAAKPKPKPAAKASPADALRNEIRALVEVEAVKPHVQRVLEETGIDFGEIKMLNAGTLTRLVTPLRKIKADAAGNEGA